MYIQLNCTHLTLSHFLGSGIRMSPERWIIIIQQAHLIQFQEVLDMIRFHLEWLVPNLEREKGFQF